MSNYVHVTGRTSHAAIMSSGELAHGQPDVPQSTKGRGNSLLATYPVAHMPAREPSPSVLPGRGE